MASKSTVKSLLECTICKDRIRRPRALPCIHTFCQNCLQAVINSIANRQDIRAGFECPLCRRLTLPPTEERQLPDHQTWAALFPTNPTIVILNESTENNESTVQDGEGDSHFGYISNNNSTFMSGHSPNDNSESDDNDDNSNVNSADDYHHVDGEAIAAASVSGAANVDPMSELQQPIILTGIQQHQQSVSFTQRAQRIQLPSHATQQPRHPIRLSQVPQPFQLCTCSNLQHPHSASVHQVHRQLHPPSVNQSPDQPYIASVNQEPRHPHPAGINQGPQQPYLASVYQGPLNPHPASINQGTQQPSQASIIIRPQARVGHDYLQPHPANEFQERHQPYPVNISHIPYQTHVSSVNQGHQQLHLSNINQGHQQSNFQGPQ
ncbi:activating signal cointegrator 1 complex subunit 2 homolog [Mya arenaria]|uniref:activating signal cointegrator 1 complex subunit 2 homolog n=1 Tax=Mya arenaria TaxID=6604 RepID=UPI0022E719CE|nr:activating signal cointegrator 1 complex subunit 2 homolog [Mya arenaria]